MKVKVEDLVRRFNNFTAVDHVSFSFKSGDIVGFVGHNGAGKTTTMRIMAGFDQTTSGDILYDDISVTYDAIAAHQVVGFVPDDLPVYENTTTHEYVDFYARAHGLKGKMRDQVVAEMEDFTGLLPMKDKLLRSLSKGMKQRACLARALIHNPDVLILDEPAAGLDPRARIELRELLFLLAKQGKAILISSHILTELTEICNRVVIIDHGKLIETGTVSEITHRSSTQTLVSLRLLGDHDKWLEVIHQLPNIVDINANKELLEIKLNSPEEGVVELLRELIQRDVPIVECQVKNNNLEDVFMRLTEK